MKYTPYNLGSLSLVDVELVEPNFVTIYLFIYLSVSRGDLGPPSMAGVREAPQKGCLAHPRAALPCGLPPRHPVLLLPFAC